MNGAEIFGLIKIKVPEAVKEDQTGAVIIPRGSLLEAARYLISPALDFDNLHCITAIDRKENIELIYYFCSMQKHQNITLKVRLLPSPSPLPHGERDILSTKSSPLRGEDTDEGTKIIDNLEVESLTGYWKSADWLEREVYDLFGVKFLNHPNLKRILNPDEWTIHPLRKT